MTPFEALSGPRSSAHASAAAATASSAGSEPRPFPLRSVLIVVALLTVLDGLARLTYWGRHRVEDGWLRWFNAAAEGTVPSLAAVGAMALLGGVCLLRRTRPVRWWRTAGALFLYLAIDDLFGLHETFGALLHPRLGGHGVYVWVFTLAPVFAIVAAMCATRLWSGLETSVQRGLMMLGFAALGIALGFELMEQRVLQSPLRPRGLPLIAYTQWLEEALELLGPVLLLAACWPRAPRPVVRTRVGDPVLFVGAGR